MAAEIETVAEKRRNEEPGLSTVPFEDYAYRKSKNWGLQENLVL